MDLVARKKLNLDVLKKHDPNICDILDQSAHAVVYKFDTEKQTWEKLGYEGVIFLTQGKNAPYFGLYVLNRLSIENFSLHLTDFEEINLTDEFIIYQTSEGEACALWLFEKKDRERILAKILKLHEGIKALPSTQQQQQQQQPKPTESKVDILQMLKKATTPVTTTADKPSSPSLKSVGSDLLRVLGGNQQQQQPQQPPQMSMPMPNRATPIHEKTEGNNTLQDIFNSANNHNENDKAMLMNALNNNMNNMNMGMSKDMPSRKALANGELTKPFYPPFMNMSPNGASPGANSLLQALHGGLPPPPPPPPPMAMPLLPQQVMGMMRPEVNRRFAGRPMLSKPEFIQQLLNMIQCDPTFFDVLYESYKDQMVHPPPPPPSTFQ